MKIAIDLRSLMSDAKISGVENYLLNLFNQLEHRAPELGIVPFYNSWQPVRFQEEFNMHTPVSVSRVPNRLLNASLIAFGAPKFESLYGNFDALWMPDLRPFAIRDSTKLALTVHDLSAVVHPEFYSVKRRIWHRLVNYRKSLARADLIFAVSEYTKYDIQKLFGIRPEKIKVVYPGIDHRVFRTDLDQRLRHKVREKYSLPDEYILSISTVEPRKNILGLIAAFEQLPNDGTELVIAGKLGWLYNEVLRRIASSPARQRIRMLGYVREIDKPYLIAQAKVVCYPSFYEGFGFVPLEAFACGVPVVTSARTSMPEICDDAALLVEPRQLADLVYALRSVLADQQLRQTLVRKGLERVKQFSWQHSAEQISSHLLSLV